MPARHGVSGLAVGVAMAGGIVLAAGFKNASISDTLRALIKNQPIPSKTQSTAVSQYLGGVADAAASGGGGASGNFGSPTGEAAVSGLGVAIVDDARKYIGVPYRFGGADPSGFDCSGLVTYVLAHDLGINLPSNSHTVTGQFFMWSGATDVNLIVDLPRLGDLVCWTGHIGIYSGGGKMIHAPHTGTTVQESTIWNVPPPLYRRVKG